MTADQLVAKFRKQFDSDDATALGYLNDRQARMVADALFRSAEVTIASTVAGTDRYAVSGDVVDLRRVYIGDEHYDPVSGDDLRALLDPSDEVRLSGRGGVFADAYLADGTLQIRLFPAPTTTGDAIVGIEALQPAALALGSSQSPMIPTDLHAYLFDGMLADGYAHIDERPDMSSFHEQRFEQGVEKLRRRKVGRIGGGAAQPRVLGFS